MTRTYGVGIIGCGNISTSYLRLAPLFAGIEVRAVADIVPEAARKRSEEFGVAAQSPEELLKNSEIDVVVNLTLPATHFSVSMDAVTAGKHVYSEKPFVLALSEGIALRDAAAARGLKVGSAPDTFLGGSHQQVRNLIDVGEAGSIGSGTAHIMGRGHEYWHPNPDFYYQTGGGPLLDMGPYYITDLVQLLGPVRRVAGMTGMAQKERTIHAPGSPRLGQKVTVETPTTIHGVLEFAGGAIVTLGASFDVKSHGHSPIELYGTEASVFVPDPNFFGGAVAIGRNGGQRETVAPWHHPLGVDNQDSHDGTRLANYRSAGLADMMASIEAGRTARCGVDVALHVIEVMTALLASGARGEMVTLTTTCERPEALGPDAAAALRA